MKRVLLGSIPILAALVLLINFVGGETQTAKAAVGFSSITKLNPIVAADATTDGPVVVETEWANFGTELTVVFIDSAVAGNLAADTYGVFVESDDADDSITFDPVTESDVDGDGDDDEGEFTFTFTVVETSGAADELEVDDEDTVTITVFTAGGDPDDDALRSTDIFVENDQPDIRGLDPEHEDVVDDSRVDFLAEVTDDDSGIPTPEDLPDGDTDDEYTTILFLRSDVQCGDADGDLDDALGVVGTEGLLTDEDGNAKTLEEVLEADCDSAGGDDITVFEVFDEDDFDDIDDGFSVDTRIDLTEGTNFITVLAVDAAGNFRVLDVDRSDEEVVLAEITVDTEDPVLAIARTGVTWDSADDEYDDARDYIQLIFTDSTDLDPASIQRTDVIVEGHEVRRVLWFDVDPEDVGDDISDKGGVTEEQYTTIRKSLFVQLEDDLEPDETPDVNIVPNGIDDEAGNTLDGGNDAETEAEDWITPEFEVLELTGPITGKLLAGEDDEMEMIITSDEDLDDDPEVTVTYVDAPAGCTIDSGAADECEFDLGRTLTADVDEIGRNRWRVTIGDPNDTGFYNIFIEGEDSEQNNGSEGIDPDDIAADFFKDNGDVNDDDAIFFQGDILLPPPLIVVAGEDDAGEYEDGVEFRNPFFIEINFEEPEDGADDNPAGADFDPLDENGEYLEDEFDDVEITLFELDGVDMTDQVATTDSRRFLVAIDNIALGEHTVTIEARDEAGNEFEDDVEADFEVEERAAFELEVRPGWNLFSLPGAPSDGAIDTVFGPGVPVTTLYTFDPTVPGGWLVAVRETSDDPWTGSLMEIDPTRGYWGLSNAIFEVNVDVPRIAGGSAGGGTPVQPPTVDLFPGWNLVPVIDVTGDAEFEDTVDADVYFGGVRDSVRQIVTFNTITNVWETVPFFEDILLDNDGNGGGDPTTDELLDDPDLSFGKAYWVFATQEATLVPGTR